MNLKIRRVLPALAAALLVASWVTPAAAAVDEPRLQALMQDAVTRLKLTPEQQALLRPLFDERNQKIKAIRDKHGNEPSRRARASMFREAKQVQQDYDKKVRAILDDTQAAEWDKMRNEARDRLKELQKAGDGPW